MPPRKRPAFHTKQPARTRREWTLVIIDNEPLRQAALEQYLAAEEQLGTVREELETFQTGDVPAYERWEATVFGSLLTQLRETNLALQEKQRLASEVEEEMFFSGRSEVTAYKRVMEARANPDAARAARERQKVPPEDDGDGPGGFEDSQTFSLPPDFDIDEFDAAPKAVQREFRQAMEAMAEVFAAMTGSPAPRFDRLLADARAKKHGAKSWDAFWEEAARHFPPQAAAAPDSRLKDLYRRLVRLLHPDSTGTDTPRARELWHELQEAYRTHDLDRMEAVAGRADLGMHGTAATLSVGLLRRMIRDLHEAVNGMRAQVARARKHPAWNFRQRGKVLPKMEAARRKTLQRGLKQAIWDLEEITAFFDNLAKRAARGKKPSGRQQRQKRHEMPEPHWERAVQGEFF